MKVSSYISFIAKTLIFSLTIWALNACEVPEDPMKIYKAKPSREVPIENKVKKEILKKEILPIKKDSLPIDTSKKNPADTTETLQRIEKKPKTFKKIYFYNIHRRSPIALFLRKEEDQTGII